MVTQSHTSSRDIIAKAPFVSGDIGELIAWHDQEGPTIDVRLAPYSEGESVTFGLSPAEARGLADQLREIADVAQRAGWTPAVLADVRERYLPGATDEEIMVRLDQLTEHLGGSPLGFRPGTLHPDAGRMLRAAVGSQTVGQIVESLDQAIEHLTDVRHVIDKLASLSQSLADLQRFYQTESEKR
jgi:hypothetical protein